MFKFTISVFLLYYIKLLLLYAVKMTFLDKNVPSFIYEQNIDCGTC